ncbi:exopolyphosphatase [Vibrio rumoiensis 1S-45]|uniref:Exopolyphosphatase n=2 Tax=Vibrio rumoiensis TaxID=76258 RepID=A0A1E5E5H1_9VIBR|nr:exopolyphosphatase [Vibrio rumoiensis 1S-45]
MTEPNVEETNTTEPNIRHIAAIDLGSNSFHMVVAKVIGNGLQIVSRHKQQVRLADGLDDYMNLDNASIQRGLDCLAMFAERLLDFSPENVRIAATHTLRQANNAHIFLSRSKHVLPFPIEVIPGVEEARLIYLGVAHTQPEWEKKLVVDIGGGSTEMIIGEGFEPHLLNSKQLGCVSYTNKYFHNGKLSKKNFSKAILSVEQKLESLSQPYKKFGWDAALGSSGTIKAIREVLIGLGYEDGLITLERLKQLIDELCQLDQIEDINLDGLTDDRKPVFAAGVAILYAIFKSLSIDCMHFSDGALREGLMYEMEERFQRSDIRMRTTENLATKHQVDFVHANNVRTQAELFLNQVGKSLDIEPNSELCSLLSWGALLHEVGLSISYKGFHRHSAYILQHTNMPGFNQEQQQVLAALVRFQRKALKLQEMPELSIYKPKQILPLIAMLRLAIVLNGQRKGSSELAPLTLSIVDVGDGNHEKDENNAHYQKWKLTSSNSEWLEENRLLHADLLTEQSYWKNAGWHLKF